MPKNKSCPPGKGKVLRCTQTIFQWGSHGSYKELRWNGVFRHHSLLSQCHSYRVRSESHQHDECTILGNVEMCRPPNSAPFYVQCFLSRTDALPPTSTDRDPPRKLPRTNVGRVTELLSLSHEDRGLVKNAQSDRVSNPGPLALKASTLPLH